MAFNNPTQPGQTRYPNMLPVQAYGYPDGSFLALLQLTNPVRLEAVIKEGTDMAMTQIMTQIEAYKIATGPTEVHGAEKELASFLLALLEFFGDGHWNSSPCSFIAGGSFFPLVFGLKHRGTFSIRSFASSM